jgi:hypothetical protein
MTWISGTVVALEFSGELGVSCAATMPGTITTAEE